MKTQIEITEANELNLEFIRTIANINQIDASNKEKLINVAIDVAYKCASSLDEESLFALTNLKKSL